MESSAPSKIWQDEYLSLADMKMKPVSENTLNELASQLITWANEAEDVYSMSAFLRLKMLRWSTFYNWLEKSKKLQAAYEYALLVLGERRERGGLTRKLDSGMVSYTMAHYDPKWKKLAEWRAKLKQENDPGTESKIVVIERFSDPKEKE